MNKYALVNEVRHSHPDCKIIPVYKTLDEQREDLISILVESFKRSSENCSNTKKEATDIIYRFQSIDNIYCNRRGYNFYRSRKPGIYLIAR